MLRAIIIDDEHHCTHRLSNLLKHYCHDEILLMDSFDNITDGIAGIEKLQPDLLFLDVELQNKTGFDLLKQLPFINFEVIFTTAYEKYAVEAFRFSAIDYLLKPVDPDELIQAVAKLKDKNRKEEIAKKFDVLFHNLQAKQNLTKKISIPTVNGLLFLEVNEIIRCQAEINYTTIYLLNKQKITVSKTLKEFEELLTPYNFYRVHNSHLININYIKSYQKGKGGTVTLADNSEIDVSTRRKEQFLKILSSSQSIENYDLFRQQGNSYSNISLERINALNTWEQHSTAYYHRTINANLYQIDIISFISLL